MKQWHLHKLASLPLLLGLSLATPALASEVEPKFDPNTLPPPYLRLLDEPWSQDPRVKSALEADGGKLQPPSQDKPILYNDISIVVNKMPLELTAETFLAELANNPNGTLQNQSFNEYLSPTGEPLNELIRRNSSQPLQVGDIYDINLGLFSELGIPNYQDDVSVMLTELTNDRFTLSSITSAKTGKHPLNESREFGFENNKDGKVSFYTRAVLQIEDLPVDVGEGFVGAPGLAWTTFIEGIGREIQNRGGDSDLNSLRSSTTIYSEGIAISHTSSTAVPEPTSTLGMLGFGGFVGASMLLKHRRKKQQLEDFWKVEKSVQLRSSDDERA